MAMKKTLWKPDTCDCEIEYEWDDSVPENQRTHSVSRIIKQCPIHKELATSEKCFGAVLEENIRKNSFLKEIMDNISEVVEETTSADGKTFKKLKDGLEYNWSFDSARNLVVDLSKFEEQLKNKIKTLAVSKFGGKVLIS